jgi:hypothetical protein
MLVIPLEGHIVTIPTLFGMSQDKDTAPASVQEIWEKTIARFHQRTGQQLNGVSRTTEDLRRALDAH